MVVYARASCPLIDIPDDFRSLLPSVRGRYVFDYDLSKMTWFKVGGNADVLFKPYDHDDLAYFLKNIASHIPVTILGAASNVLVRDGGIRGVVIKLSKGFSDISYDLSCAHTETSDMNARIQSIPHDDVVHVTVGAACLDRTFVLELEQMGLSGLEFLVGVPGTIGGAIAMNAGAYGGEIKDCLVWIDLITHAGDSVRLSASDIHMTYRHGNLPEGAIITRACFSLIRKRSDDIHQRIESYLKQREDAQPIKGRTGGSTFKNPVDVPQKAWELIDAAGCRGLSLNDAEVSHKHCNFLLNTNHASAVDLETLGDTVRDRVHAQSGVWLEWEIMRIGDY